MVRRLFLTYVLLAGIAVASRGEAAELALDSPTETITSADRCFEPHFCAGGRGA